MPAAPAFNPLVDALGVEHRPAGAPCRIVSLVPSITELLFDLGVADRLVGRTGFCVHPRPAIDALPKVGGTKDVNLERLRTLAPTHVIVNVDENEAGLTDTLREFVPFIVVTHPQLPEDNLHLYRMMGVLFQAESAAEDLCAQLQRELATCRATEWPRERVLYLIWREPWMTVASDTYIAGMLQRVGWEVPYPPGGFAGAARYPAVDLTIEVPRVDRVLLSSEPYLFNEADRAELARLFPRTAVELIDAEMTSWYGSRAIRGLQHLRESRLKGLARARARQPTA
ncbi:MAG: ABC transporter substrate-binding protein [Burkholderiales bacterium]|jgi:ABC-type Fe3+-hydroxamate transport system substrate-binding protein|nr:ABC transporter substrate-binding protein [Burkholderiales bacterium]